MAERAAYRMTLRPDLTGVPAGEYDLYVSLFAGERPVYLVLKDEICEEGSYRIRRSVKVKAVSAAPDRPHGKRIGCCMSP